MNSWEWSREAGRWGEERTGEGRGGEEKGGEGRRGEGRREAERGGGMVTVMRRVRDDGSGAWPSA